MPLSREEVINTVQNLIGPNFQVKLSHSDVEYIRGLEGHDLELAILQAVYGQLVMNGASQTKLAGLTGVMTKLSMEISKNETQKLKEAYKDPPKVVPINKTQTQHEPITNHTGQIQNALQQHQQNAFAALSAIAGSLEFPVPLHSDFYGLEGLGLGNPKL